MANPIVWAQESHKNESGKIVEHVSFGSFVKKFKLKNKDHAIKRYQDLLNSKLLLAKRQKRLQQAFEQFQTSRLPAFWASWVQAGVLQDTQKNLDVNAKIISKKTAILAQNASLHESETSFAAPEPTQASTTSATEATTSATEATPNEAELGLVEALNLIYGQPLDESDSWTGMVDESDPWTGMVDESDPWTGIIDDEEPDLTIAAPPSGNKSSPFYGLINYMFQKAKGKSATLPTMAPSGISPLHQEMYMAALQELRRPGPMFNKKDALVILSTIVNTVARSGRSFSISKDVRKGSLLSGLDPQSDIYLSVKDLLRELLVALHPQIDHDRHCPPQFGNLKKCVWKLLSSTPENTANYSVLQVVNQLILYIELGIFEDPTSEQVGELICKPSGDARQRTEDAFGSTTSTTSGRKVDLSIRIRVENKWKTEIAIFEFKSSKSTDETCKKQQKKSVRINAAILLDLESRGLDISQSFPIIAEGRALTMDFYTLRRYQDVLGAGKSTSKGISLPSQVDELKAFLQSNTVVTLLSFKDHLRRFAVDVKDVLAMSARTSFGNSSGEDTGDEDTDESTGEDAGGTGDNEGTRNARAITPPPKKRPNPYIVYSPSRQNKKQRHVGFVDDDEDDD
ncbi:MAG: hypothetical protein J3Q66DRAFT_407535 [Benniella sp.]|nr:MAG: hypothetical protein J3Q66DRAFT_407535 [Benniella sp.]